MTSLHWTNVTVKMRRHEVAMNRAPVHLPIAERAPTLQLGICSVPFVLVNIVLVQVGKHRFSTVNRLSASLPSDGKGAYHRLESTETGLGFCNDIAVEEGIGCDTAKEDPLLGRVPFFSLL